jgi:hypothetical protein|eukprot:COSAG01_NODE_10132_length_2242_cov_1.648157_3_plen_172_part_00
MLPAFISTQYMHALLHLSTHHQTGQQLWRATKPSSQSSRPGETCMAARSKDRSLHRRAHMSLPQCHQQQRTHRPLVPKQSTFAQYALPVKASRPAALHRNSLVPSNSGISNENVSHCIIDTESYLNQIFRHLWKPRHYSAHRPQQSAHFVAHTLLLRSAHDSSVAAPTNCR